MSNSESIQPNNNFPNFTTFLPASAEDTIYMRTEWRTPEMVVADWTSLIGLLSYNGARQQSSTDQSYETFTLTDGEDLYKIGKGLTEYARDQNVGTVLFVDRSARAAYIPMTEYWNDKYPDEKKPDIRFINPKGCISQEDVKAGRIDPHDVLKNDFFKGGYPETEDAIRPRDEVVAEIRNALENSKHADEPILLIDACIHTGQTLTPVIDRLFEAGVKPGNLLIGTVSAADLYTDRVRPDFVVMEDQPSRYCQPVGPDSATQKRYGSVASSKNNDPLGKQLARALRSEIHRAMSEQIAKNKHE